jgi:group I intron endonuclease
MVGIYKITSPSGKVYVGQSIDIERRIKKYNSLNCGNQTKLINSFNKYGVDTHVFDTIVECNEQSLNQLERKWQEHYKAVENGLNCRYTETTDKSGRLSEETKKRIGQSHKGRIHTDASKSNMRVPKSDSSNMGRYDKSGNNNPFYGKTHTEETKNIIREKRKQQVFTEETRNKISQRLKKIVLQFNKDGEFIKEHQSRNGAATELGINPTAISNNISGRNKSAGGYVWKYKN